MKITSYGRFCDDLKVYGVDYAADHSVALGFDSVEPLEMSPSNELNVDIVGLKRMDKALARNNLTVACYSVGTTIYPVADDKAVQDLCRIASFAADLGSPYLHHTLNFGLTLPDGAPKYDDIINGTLAVAERIANHCDKLGMTVIYEPQGMYYNGRDGLSRFYNEMKKRCPNVGICGDVGNSVFVDEMPNGVFDALAKEVKHVHIKDYIYRMNPLERTEDYRSRGGAYIYETLPGTGDIDIAYCMKKLAEAGYDGALGFEINVSDEEMLRAVEYVKGLFSI